MKSLVNYINENTEEQIDESVLGVANFPRVSEFPPEQQPYAIAFYIVIMIWLSIFCITVGDEPFMGLKTLYNVVKEKFSDFKFNKQVKEVKKLLEQDPEYKEWESDKKHRLKDLKPIIDKYKSDSDMKAILNTIWDESKKK